MTNLLNAFPLASFIVGQDGYVVGANEQGNPRTDAVTRDDRKHSQWYDRNTLWLYSRGKQ